jgi:hypothetical protein
VPFGQVIVPFAQDLEPNFGVGGIQPLQAGLVPDEIAVNTCDD